MKQMTDQEMIEFVLSMSVHFDPRCKEKMLEVGRDEGTLENPMSLIWNNLEQGVRLAFLVSFSQKRPVYLCKAGNTIIEVVGQMTHTAPYQVVFSGSIRMVRSDSEYIEEITLPQVFAIGKALGLEVKN